MITEYPFLYLFRDDNNLHCVTYEPFACTKELTQEQATRFILAKHSEAHYVGCHFPRFVGAAKEHGYDLFSIDECYVLPEERVSYQKEPDLPQKYKDLPIIRTVTGKY